MMPTDTETGIDIACRAAHQGGVADERGQLQWLGWRFHTTPAELAWLRTTILPAYTDPAQVRLIMEPTRVRGTAQYAGSRNVLRADGPVYQY
jgi:hypothetical protein